MFKTYYRLTKPGIIYGNAMTATAGFFLASKGHISLLLLISMLLGTSFVIASACVFNNYIDRGIDKKMDRTKNRALVTGKVPVKNALIFATFLGVLGVSILFLFINLMTLIVGVIGFFVYIVLYGYSKRHSIHGTVIGSISGAMPPVAGYTAVTNRVDIGAILLFLILVFWQMPHFYAIAIYRLKDYAAAGIPVMPVKKGILNTKIQILIYILGFVIVGTLFTFFGYTGTGFLVIITLMGIVWLWLTIQGFFTKNSNLWARKMFFFSLIVTLIFSILISIEGFVKL